MLECMLDHYTLYSLQTHKAIHVQPVSAYYLQPKGKRLLVGHNGKARTYHYTTTQKRINIYNSGKFLIMYDTEENQYYIKRVDKPYTIRLICKERNNE